MEREILRGKEAKEKLKKGIDEVANAVKTTLGARGKNVVIDVHPTVAPIVTKDGVTVAESIYLSDPVENMGAQLVKDVSRRAASEAGDGTSTSSVLAQAILDSGMKVSNKRNVSLLKKGIDLTVERIVEELHKMSVPVKGNYSLIEKVATVSANGDSEIGKMIADAMKQVGENGYVNYEAGKSHLTEVKITNGVELQSGVINENMLLGNPKLEYEDCLVAVVSNVIMTPQEAVSIMKPAFDVQKPLLIICKDLGGVALNDVIANHVKGNVKCVAVRAVGNSEEFFDLAAIFGCEVIGDSGTVSIDKVSLESLGSVGKVTVSKDKTEVIGVENDRERVDEIVDRLLLQLSEEETSYAKEAIKKRIARIKGAVALITVGGNSEAEIGEKLDRVEDAVKAARAAVEEGVVEGGGVALLRIANAFEEGSIELDFDTNDEEVGRDIIISAIQRPFFQILLNADKRERKSFWKYILGSELDRYKKLTLSCNEAYNVKTERFENFIKSGIVDPCKVTRVALESASSVAGTLLTTEVSINYKKNLDASNKR